MKIELEPDELKILTHAAKACRCESYYNYRCLKCAELHLPVDLPAAVTSLLNAALIYRNSYHGLRPTKAGIALANSLGILCYRVYNGTGNKQEA